MMERVWEEEHRLQRKVLWATFKGEKVDPEELASWRRIREEIGDALVGAGRAQAQAVLEKELLCLQERLDSLEDGEISTAAKAAAHHEFLYFETSLVGEKLRWMRRLAGSRLQNKPFHPASLLNGEIHQVRNQAESIGKLDPSLKETAGKLHEEGSRARSRLKGVSIDSWLERATGDPVGGTDKREFAEEEASDDPRVQSFRPLWWRVLEYYSIVSDLMPGDPEIGSRRDALSQQHERDLSDCRRLLGELEGASREACFLAAVQSLEDQLSSLISEADVLELGERIVKLKVVSCGADEFDELLKEYKKESRSWSQAFAQAHRRVRSAYSYSFKSSRSLGVEARLEETFGRGFTRRFESFVFFMIFLLVLLVAVQWRLESYWEAKSPVNPDSPNFEPAPWSIYFDYADLIICLILLSDFFLRWAFAKWRFWFFRQHFLFDFLPALPYGFIAGQLTQLPPGAGYAHMILLIRFARAVGQGLRSAAPFLRLFRLSVFLVRGIDRVVQHFRGFLDRHILLFESETPGDGDSESLVAVLEKEAIRSIVLLRELSNEVDGTQRLCLLRGYLRVLNYEVATLSRKDFAKLEHEGQGEDIRLETVIHQLVSCDVLTVEKVVSREGAKRVSRFLSWFDFPGLRSLPVIRRFIPAARIKNPLEALTTAAREAGQMFQEILAIFAVWGDLSGITTGPQVLDRISTAMIRATQRPAVRLLIFGGIFIVVYLFFGLVFQPADDQNDHWMMVYILNPLGRILGLPLLILGSLCLVVNFFGRWFKKIAGEALDVYLRTSEAHFFPLLKDIKTDRIDRDIEEIRNRVVAPECRIRDRSEITPDRAVSQLCRILGKHETVAATAGENGFSPELRRELEQVALLYRDYLDSTPLRRADDQTSIQLLGNMAMRDIRSSMLRFSKRELRRLERLALRKDRLLGLGPYLWFRFISESMAIETAKLVIEYNTYCVPRRRLEGAPVEMRQRFEKFLEEKQAVVDPASLRLARSRALAAGQPMATTEFHALHFLRADSERDQRITEIFGDEVRKAVVRDRQAMARDIFGTWPFHLLPRSVRRINPYRLYFRYLRGARIYLFPLMVLWKTVQLLFFALVEVGKAVQEVLGKVEVSGSRLNRVAGFDVAKRKINRMRKPYFMEAMKVRAAVDVEYLGLRIPGVRGELQKRPYREDLDFIGALQRERFPFEELRRQAIRDLRRLRHFLGERGWLGADFSEGIRMLGAKDVREQHVGQVLRAVVAAFITDSHGLRSNITGPDEIQSFFDRIPWQDGGGVIRSLWRAVKRNVIGRLLPESRRRRRLFSRYWDQHERFQRRSGHQRRRALDAFLASGSDMVHYCEIAVDRDASEKDYNATILNALQRVVSEYTLWTHKLITLRTIQTITVLDVRVYQDLVWTLGGFAENDGVDVQEESGPRITRMKTNEEKKVSFK